MRTAHFLTCSWPWPRSLAFNAIIIFIQTSDINILMSSHTHTHVACQPFYNMLANRWNALVDDHFLFMLHPMTPSGFHLRGKNLYSYPYKMFSNLFSSAFHSFLWQMQTKTSWNPTWSESRGFATEMKARDNCPSVATWQGGVDSH